MANFFSPIQPSHRPSGGTIQNTPPPPGLPFNMPANNINGFGSHSSHSTTSLLVTAAPNNSTSNPGSGSASATVQNTAAQYQERLERFQRADGERNEMIQELIRNLHDTTRKYHEVQDDLQSEQQSRRILQQHARKVEQSLDVQTRENARLTDANPFVFVIIDGDGAIFNDELLARGAEGGAEAAHRLATGIRNHLKSMYSDATVENWNIMVQLVLNMEGLAKKLLSCKIISVLDDLYKFGVGFSRSQHLFSFVDVGVGKERADHKVREMFSFMARMVQCKHLYFGPCHDNGYLPFLEPYLRDPYMQSRTTLFEATVAEPGFRTYNRVTFENVFRAENLPAKPQGFIAAAAASAASAAVRRSSEIATSAMNNKGPPAAAKPSSTESSSPPQPKSATPAPSSWAAMSKPGAGTGKTIDIAPAKKPPRKSILLNKDYERLDEQLPAQQPTYQKKFSDRIKDKNCCNNFHLKGHCANGDGCVFQHGERLSVGEQIVLRHKARSIKCNAGSWCEDFDCPYGHRCKFGGKECGHDDCRFFDTHHVDSRPAMRKYEDGTYEQV